MLLLKRSGPKEIFLGVVPYGLIVSENRVITEIVMGEPPCKPESIQCRDDWDSFLWPLCTKCWEKQPEKRISMAEFVEEMNECVRFVLQKLHIADDGSSHPLDHAM